jgi:hypothetical protein
VSLAPLSGAEECPANPGARIFKEPADDFSFWEKPVRADIFVVWRFKNESSSVRATSSGYAAPTELEIVFVLGSTKMPRLRRWGLSGQ